MAGLLRCEQKGIWFDKMAWLLYSFPGLVNYILGGMMFITAYRFSEADAPGWVVGASLAMWSAVYLLSSLGLMRFITPGNAARLIFGGGVVIPLLLLHRFNLKSSLTKQIDHSVFSRQMTRTDHKESALFRK